MPVELGHLGGTKRSNSIIVNGAKVRLVQSFTTGLGHMEPGKNHTYPAGSTGTKISDNGRYRYTVRMDATGKVIHGTRDCFAASK